MKIDRAIDFLLSLSRSPLLLLLVNRLAVNKSRIDRQRLIASVIKYLLVDYGREGMLGDLTVFEAKNLQLMHDGLLLHRLKGRAQGVSGKRHEQLKSSIENIQQRTDFLKKLEGPDTLRFLANLYLEDIAPDFNPAFLILFRAVGKRLFNHFVDSIRAVETLPGTINEVRRLVGNEPVFFIANHISNADHLPILFALNRAGVISPVVIAGSNLYRGISRKILPKLNVCQLKRDDMIEKKIKWLGNPLYIETFKQHNQYMWLHNEPYLFYPEGGRSRSGKILKPKVGIIKNIFEFVEKRDRSVYFVPISLSYTCVPEDLAIEESRKGVNISYGDLIQQLVKLNREYGSLQETTTFVNLGQPLKISPGELPELEDFSDQLMHRVRAGICTTPTYEVAPMIINLCATGKERYRFTLADLKNAAPDYDFKRLNLGLEVFAAKKFIKPGTEPDTFEIVNHDLLKQYANRTECDF
ncbi:MAG: 1-acyl-sn-glycerol-3-phosphate acyltransferase [Deltaproteobacteria bacterium]|nr:1-acyl-sn-glycerol-3-phosphate acyltransferase [Deltaproteobacteria bacterium]